LHEEILTVTARWLDIESRKDGLTPYAREAEARTLELLETSLRPGPKGVVPAADAQRLHASIPCDIETLLPHLEQRGLEAKADAEKRLAERGRIESESLRKILEDQRTRVLAQLGRHDTAQGEFEALLKQLNDGEKRQLQANRKYWQAWLENVDGDLKREPGRILNFYKTASYRIEPVGLAYLWPVTG